MPEPIRTATSEWDRLDSRALPATRLRSAQRRPILAEPRKSLRGPTAARQKELRRSSAPIRKPQRARKPRLPEPAAGDDDGRPFLVALRKCAAPHDGNFEGLEVPCGNPRHDRGAP